MNEDLLKLKRVYDKNYSLGFLGRDINTKFALISLICYITYKLSEKHQTITCYDVIKKIIGNNVPDKFINSLSVVCEDFYYECNNFPTFGIPDNEIPSKVREILLSRLPF